MPKFSSQFHLVFTEIFPLEFLPQGSPLHVIFGPQMKKHLKIAGSEECLLFSLIADIAAEDSNI